MTSVSPPTPPVDSPSRTGPLRNGNPRGNPALAPRCGAKTRAGGCCQAPAVRGRTRCRMHGGASTGPRTAAGLARLTAAHTRHGLFTAAMRAEFHFDRVLAERTRVLCGAVDQLVRLPMALRRRLLAGEAPELLPPPRPDRVVDPAPMGQDGGRARGRHAVRDAGGRFVARPVVIRGMAAERRAARAEAEALAPWKAAIAAARAARRAERALRRSGRGQPGGGASPSAPADFADREQDPLHCGPGADRVPDRTRPRDSEGRREDVAADRGASEDMRGFGQNPMDRGPGADRVPDRTRPRDSEGRREDVAVDRGVSEDMRGFGQNPMDRGPGADRVPDRMRSRGGGDGADADRDASEDRRGNGQNPLDRGTGRGWGGDGPLVTALWGTVASPALGLRARLLGGTSRDDSPFWVGLDCGLEKMRAEIAAGAAAAMAIKAQAFYARR